MGMSYRTQSTLMRSRSIMPSKGRITGHKPKANYEGYGLVQPSTSKVEGLLGPSITKRLTAILISFLFVIFFSRISVHSPIQGNINKSSLFAYYAFFLISIPFAKDKLFS